MVSNVIYIAKFNINKINKRISSSVTFLYLAFFYIYVFNNYNNANKYVCVESKL